MPVAAAEVVMLGRRRRAEWQNDFGHIFATYAPPQGNSHFRYHTKLAHTVATPWAKREVAQVADGHHMI